MILHEDAYEGLHTFADVQAMLDKVSSHKALDALNDAVQERFIRDVQQLAMTNADWDEWTILLARKADQLEREQTSAAGGDLAYIRHAVQAYRDSRPIDRFDYDRRIKEIQGDIGQDWMQGNPDGYSYRYGPDVIREQMKHEGIAEHFDVDGDLTETGWKRRDELEGELSAQIARDALGEPPRKVVDITRADHMAEFLHEYLEKAGFDPHAIGGSGKSLSKYFAVPVGQDQYIIRISDHKLPSEYSPGDRELALYDVSDCDVRSDGRELSNGIDEDEAIHRAAGLVGELRTLKARGDLSAFLEANRDFCTAVPVDTAKGDYSGPFVFVNEHYAVQSLGRGAGAVHEVRSWETKPAPGQYGTVRYRDGASEIILKTPGREQGKGSGLSLGC